SPCSSACSRARRRRRVLSRSDRPPLRSEPPRRIAQLRLALDLLARRNDRREFRLLPRGALPRARRSDLSLRDRRGRRWTGGGRVCTRDILMTYTWVPI